MFIIAIRSVYIPRVSQIHVFFLKIFKGDTRYLVISPRPSEVIFPGFVHSFSTLPIRFPVFDSRFLDWDNRFEVQLRRGKVQVKSSLRVQG